MKNELAREITDFLIEARLDLSVDFLSIAMNTSKTSLKEIKWLFASGNRNNRYQKIVLQVGKGIAGIVWKTGRPMAVTNLKNEMNGTLEEYPIAITENLISILAIPILIDQEVMAIFLGGYRKETQLEKIKLEQLEKISTELAPKLIQFINGKDNLDELIH